MVFQKVGNSKGNTGLQLENYKIGQICSITINPESQPNCAKSMNRWLFGIRNHLLKYIDACNMILYPEASATGRLHFHGTIKIKDPFKMIWFLKDLNESTHFEIDTLQECICHLKPNGTAKAHSKPNGTATATKEEFECGNCKWSMYMRKQFSIMYKVTNVINYPIRIDETSVTIEASAARLDLRPKGLERFGITDSPQGDSPNPLEINCYSRRVRQEDDDS